MFGLIIAIHIIVCIILIFIILIQSGRSSGLVESFSFAESILGTKTPKFFTKLTVILASVFILNCLFLTFLTYQRSRSLIEKEAVKTQKQEAIKEKEIPKTSIPDIPIEETQELAPIEEKAQEPSLPSE